MSRPSCACGYVVIFPNRVSIFCLGIFWVLVSDRDGPIIITLRNNHIGFPFF